MGRVELTTRAALAPFRQAPRSQRTKRASRAPQSPALLDGSQGPRDTAARVAKSVSRGEADAGIIIDGAGIGSAIAANKIAGVRAAGEFLPVCLPAQRFERSEAAQRGDRCLFGRAGAEPVGLQVTQWRVPCGSIAFPCAASTLVPLYASETAPRTLSTTDAGSSIEIGIAPIEA